MIVSEWSLGRAIALVVFAPIAERLAEQRERTQRQDTRRRQLEDELAALPSLDRPTAPGPWTPWWKTSELREVLLGLAIVGIPVVVVVTGVFAYALGSTPAALVLGALCGSAIVSARTVKTIKTTLAEVRRGREAAAAQADYAKAVKTCDEREEARNAIRVRLEEVSR